jgi:hypothetical protein
MAKKIITDTAPAAPMAAEAMSAPTVAGASASDGDTEEGAENGTASGTGQDSGEPEPPVSEEGTQPSAPTPDYADRLLKIYPAYGQLYIDRLGGTYTADAPPVFRTNTTLYTNPYHKD